MPELDAVLSAISDPTRREILHRLALGPARMTDLAKPFPMSLPAVSKHLKVLESAGLVTRVRHGREHTMYLRAEPLREVASWAGQYQRFWTERVDHLQQFFEERRRKA